MDHRRYWLARARRLAFFHNAARWLDFFLPALVVVSVAAAASLLVLRDRRSDPPWFWSALGVAVALAGLGGLLSLRHRTLSVRRALTWLDVRGGLHARLSAAEEGVGPWPAPRRVDDGVEPRWSRLLAPGALCAGLLAGSVWVPLPEHDARSAPLEKPLAWSQVESWLETLKHSKAVDPPALEKLGQQLNELQQQPAAKWFQQSSLEAGDTLRSQTQQALRNMEGQLGTLEKVINEATHPGAAALPPERLQQMQTAVSQALEGLQSGNLPLNKELLKQLKDFDPGQLRQLSPETMNELRDRMQQVQAICEKCVGPNPGDSGANETEPGGGGSGGGGETAPLTFNHPPAPPGQAVENLPSNDLSHALPAELQAVTAGEHEVKKEVPAGPIAGGEIASPGQGGETVWRSSVLPAERTVLQKYFK